MTIEVEITRTADADELAQVLSAHGFAADTREAGRILVEAEACVDVEHALEEWAAERGLPFVPKCIDDARVVFTPPGS